MRLRDRLPAFCKRQKIFLSYPSEEELLAGEIALALKSYGHVVFFDKESLPPATDFRKQIERAIRASDRFIFLASRSALTEGRYTRTELGLAKERWPSPQGHVYTIIVDPNLPPAALPPYLKSVQLVKRDGEVPADVARAIERGANVNWTCRACLIISTLALSGVIALALDLVPMREWRATIDDPRFSITRPKDHDTVPGGANSVEARIAQTGRRFYLIVTSLSTQQSYVESEFSAASPDGTSYANVRYGSASDCGKRFTLEILESDTMLETGNLPNIPVGAGRSPSITVTRGQC